MNRWFKPTEKVAGKQRPNDRPLYATDNPGLSDLREVCLDAESLVIILASSLFFPWLSVYAVPVHVIALDVL
jgi:hypothetical protein